LINFIIESVVGILGSNDADTEQVAELAANRVDLLIDLAGDFPNIKGPVRIAVK